MKSLMNKKSIIITILVIIAVALAIFLTAKLSNVQKNEDNIISMEKIDEDNLFENENNLITNNYIEENINNIIVEEENNNDVVVNTNSNTVVSNEMTDTEDYKEKALRLVQEDWGEDDSVYFDIAEIQENGIYKICVRNKNTTNEVMWYEVDVVNNTVKML